MQADNTFDLIKSLTKSEKRYFRLFANLQKRGDKKYLKLFDAMVDMEEFDEYKLRKILAGEQLLNELHVAKNYLTKLILASLRIQESDKTRNLRIMEMLQEHLILYRRGLYQFSYKKLKKAKEFAYKYNLYTHLPLILTFEVRLASTSKDFNTDTSVLRSLSSELIDSTTNLEWQSRLYAASLNVHSQMLFGSKETESDAQLLQSDIEIIGSKAERYELISPPAFLASHKILFDFALLSGKLEQAKEFAEKRINFLLKGTNAQEHFYQYFLALHDSFCCDVFLRLIPGTTIPNNAEFQSFIEKLDRFRSVDAVMEELNWRIKTDIMIRWYTATGHYLEGVQLLQKEESRFFSQGTQDFYRPFNIFHAAILHFGAGEYSKSLHYINEIINDPSFKQTSRIVLSAKILAMVVYFELGDYDYLKKYTSDYLKILRKVDAESDFDTQLTSLFMEVIDEPSQEKRRDLYLSALSNLAKHKEMTGGFVYFYFDLATWLEAKAEGKSMEELLKAKFKTAGDLKVSQQPKVLS